MVATTQHAKLGRTHAEKDNAYSWQGQAKNGQPRQGEIRAQSAQHASLLLRKQGIVVKTIKPLKAPPISRISRKDIAVIVRQLATMLKAGVPIAQAFDMMAQSNNKSAQKQLLLAIKNDIEGGLSLSQTLRKYPRYFNQLFCGVLEAGEQAGMLDEMIERLAVYEEKSLRLKAKIKSAMTYPTIVIVVAFLVTAIILIKVIPTFKKVFADFNAELPLPTQVVMSLSDFMVDYWFWIFGAIIAFVYFFIQTLRRSPAFRAKVDRLVLKLPLFGPLLRTAIIARWARTFCTLFAAGVPMVDALDSVSIVANNDVYFQATKKIQADVAGGIKLSAGMNKTEVFPALATQLVTIGEESGALESMLDRVATQMEEEVDTTVANISSLIEPFIMVFLGIVIGGLIISMYLPIFKLGSVI